MPWYAAKIVMECSVEVEDDRLCDEQIRVIDAADADVAYELAQAIGRDEEGCFPNAEEQEVCWKFCGLSDLVLLSADRIESGVEVFSSLYRKTQASELVAEKSDLTVFRMQEYGDRTARELLSQDLRRYAPK